jgi:voltage-gated potassium channel Kch
VSGTSELLLGVIAVAVAVMAIIQVSAVIAGMRVARRVEHIATELEAGIKPLLAKLTSLSTEATKAATLAASQVERVDKVFGELTTGVEQTLASAQRLMAGPAREGIAIVAGVRAAVSAFQGLRENSRRRGGASRTPAGEEEEESLFIG